MADREELRKTVLTRYKRDFDIWLNDFKLTGDYKNIVDDYEECWNEIYKELHRIFKENVWNPLNLTNKNEVSTNQYDQKRSSENEQLNNYRREFDKWLNDFKNNYRKDFDKWLAGFKKTNVYDDEEFEARYNKELHQIFKETVWEPMLLARISSENELL